MCVCLAIALVWVMNFSISSDAAASASASRGRLIHLVGQPAELRRADVEPLLVATAPAAPARRSAPPPGWPRPPAPARCSRILPASSAADAHHQRLLVGPLGQVAGGARDFLGGRGHLLGGRRDLLRHRGRIVGVLADGAHQVAQLVQHRVDRAGQPGIVTPRAGPFGNSEVALSHSTRDRLRQPRGPEHPADQEEHDRKLDGDRREREAQRAAQHQRHRRLPVDPGRVDQRPQQHRDDRRQQCHRREPRYVQADDQISGDGTHASDVPVRVSGGSAASGLCASSRPMPSDGIARAKRCP